MGASISLDGVAVYPDCWFVCLCYFHFAPENPEDGEMCLLVPANPGFPGQSPESCEMVVCVCVCGKILWRMEETNYISSIQLTSIV